MQVYGAYVVNFIKIPRTRFYVAGSRLRLILINHLCLSRRILWRCLASVMNKQTNTLRRASVLGLAVTGATASLSAEESVGDAASQELAPYVVVATRTPLGLDRVSPSVSYISEAEIQQNQDRSVVDVLKRQPGVVLNTSGATGSLASLFMRGTKSDHTGFFLDGRRLNPGFANQSNLEFLSVDNLSSVQVQRGASSVNYGSTGIGGVVDLQIRSDLGEKTETVSIEGEVGTHDTSRGALAASFAEEGWAFSFGASALSTDNDRSNDEYENQNVSGRADYKITETLTAELIGFYSESDKELPDELVNHNDVDSGETESWLISPGVRYENGDWSGRLFYSRSEMTVDTETFEYGFDFPWPSGMVDSRSSVESDEVYAQVDYAGFEGALISLGALYRNDEAYNSNLDFYNLSAPARPYSGRFEQTGVWSQVQWQITDALELRLGGRYDEYTDFDSSTNGSVEVLYSFTDLGLVLFAKLATSYAPPSAEDMAFDGDPDGTSLQPEESTSYEFGLKQTLFGDSLQLSAVVFRNEIEDLIGWKGMDAYNVNRATTEGVEFTAQYTPVDILDLGMAYTYLTATDDETDVRLLRRPRHMLQMSAWLSPVESVNIGLTGTGYFDREDAIFGPPPTYSKVQIDQEDYFVVDLLVDWKVTEHLSLFARVENLLDEEYDSVLGYPALGTTGYIGARLSF